MADDKHMDAAPQQVPVRVDLSSYGGSWVAIRDDAVVASAPEIGRLLDHPRVREDDTLMPVPDRLARCSVL